MTVTSLGVPSVYRTLPEIREGAPLDGPLLDTYGRIATDLRVSLTDRCNLRCTYCMPAEGLDWMPGEQLLDLGELIRLLRIAVTRLGVTSVRFTGGEPLVRQAARRRRGRDRRAAAPPRNRADHQRNRAGPPGSGPEAGRAGSDQRLARHRRRRALHRTSPAATGSPTCWRAFPRHIGQT